VANVVLLVILVPPYGIAGAGAALVGAYLVMLALMYLFTRSLFAVAFQWGRLAQIVLVMGGVTVAAELILPTDGVMGFLSRTAALLAIPLLLVAIRFFRPEEVSRMRLLAARLRPAGSG